MSNSNSKHRLWPRLWVLLLLSLLLRCCRFLPLAFCAGRCAVCEQFNLLSLHVLPFFPLCLRTLIETFGGQRCCHTHTHGGRQTMCAHYTQFYTFFLRLACTCNAALFNIKWRLIPGSTSSQSTHTHTQTPFLPRCPSRGGQVQQRQQHWWLPLGLFVRLQAAEMSRDEQRRGGWGYAYEWLGS